MALAKYVVSLSAETKSRILNVGEFLVRLQAATVIGFEWRNSSREPIQVKG